MVLPKATCINVITVTIGSLIGLYLKQFLHADVQEVVFQAIGLATFYLGVKMALKLPERFILVFIFSLLLGAIFGQSIRVDLLISDLSESIKASFMVEDALFTEGLITAFLLFCVGSMTIIGALEEGLHNKKDLLIIKSTLDGFSSIALASTYGVGVLFSVIPMFFFQGSITIFAHVLKNILNKDLMDAISSVGGVLIVGISFKLLKIGNIWLENLLPALFFIILLCLIYDKFTQKSLSPP